MNSSHVSRVIDLRIIEFNRRLAQYASLSQKEIRRLYEGGDPEIRLWLTVRYQVQVGSAAEYVAEIVRTGPENKVISIVSQLNPVPSEVVDLLLQHPSDSVRTNLALNGRFDPTPQQIERMLQDSVRDVRIGLLRRRNVTIRRDLFDQGINHPDNNLAFWYRQHKDFIPTPEQAESGLISQDVMTRRSYAFMEKFKPTDAQIARGLMDEDEVVRSAFLRRKDIILTDTQLDRCTTDASFSIRDACVHRSEYRLTQYRFERILFDKNPNILYTFTGKYPDKRTDLTGFVLHTLNHGTREVQTALANNKWIPMDERQISLGMESTDPGVRSAFEARKRATGPNRNLSSSPCSPCGRNTP